MPRQTAIAEFNGRKWYFEFLDDGVVHIDLHVDPERGNVWIILRLRDGKTINVRPVWGSVVPEMARGVQN